MNPSNISHIESPSSAPDRRRGSGRPGLHARDWLVPFVLVVWAAIPVLGGALRIVGLAGGPVIVPGHDRMAVVPLAVSLHIVAVTLFSLLGAGQCAPALRRRWPKAHRRAGAVALPAGLVVAVSGLWLTLHAPPGVHDGPALVAMRVAVSLSMLGCLALAIALIQRRRFAAHGRWALRAYGLAMGAGTQVLTGIPYLLFEGWSNQAGRTATMGAGWLFNIIVVELVVRRRRSGRARPPRGCAEWPGLVKAGRGTSPSTPAP